MDFNNILEVIVHYLQSGESLILVIEMIFPQWVY